MHSGSVLQLTKLSGFIFEGSVRRTGAVTSSGLDATPDTAVVFVAKVLKGPEVLAGYLGQEITVALADHEHVSPGTRATFFTSGLHYGDGLAVREIGRLGPEVERAVFEAMNEHADDDLMEHLRAARLVVSGVVTHVAPSDVRGRVGSEHDPEWWEFVIHVESVEKGAVKPDKPKSTDLHVTAFFAHSADITWYRSPKFHGREAGIFILHEPDAGARQAPGPVVLHPLDFLPHGELERVRALLKRIRR